MAEHEQEVFLPQEIDEQIDEYLDNKFTEDGQLDRTAQAAVHALHRHFAPAEQDSALQRVWLRLEQTQMTQARQRRTLALHPKGRRYRMLQGAPSHTRFDPLAHKLNLLAAVICVLLLTASMLVLFRLASTAHSGLPGSPANAGDSGGKQMMFVLGDNALYRLDMQTHKSIWQFQVPGGRIASGEQIIGTTCFIAGTVNDQDKLYALDIASGKIRWKLDLATHLMYYNTFLVSYNDTLYLPQVKQGSSVVQALALANGAKKWEYTLQGDKVNLLAAADGAVYGENGSQGELFALRADDGHVLWQKKVPEAGGQVERGFIVNGVLALTITSGRIEGYSTANGTKLWSHTLDGSLTGYGTTLVNGAIYVNTNRQPNQGNSIYAFSAKDGAQLWHYVDSSTSGSSYPTVTERGVYFYRYSDGHDGQTLVALDASNGKQRWTYGIHDPLTVEYPPAADNARVYLSLPDNLIKIVRATDGKSLDSFKAPGGVDPNNRVLLQVLG
ncbi:hypothetical protein EPA93_27965 [Ktedonosporobacter rubrisoli]|uniref:Pyrrolo-quinoline quinone repeat domain-containing protein n=1 Tax=Ktedonosporobacter rubrisoli TaxID=2509675 RepID=A0A4P6JX52_KTERU|nr:PQQ-binding-like beta-propeller repeat protein [Ktedonosporobacter rubrisoli]QBD79606.1 hypothetical protein EPA93_27965 [Ktedonosporobacter rubrisoli]